jgi:hypothetical protein
MVGEIRAWATVVLIRWAARRQNAAGARVVQSGAQPLGRRGKAFQAVSPFILHPGLRGD